MKKICSLLFGLVLTIVLVACQTVVNYTVTFDSNGGSIVESQIVEKGAYAVLPEAPIYEGYNFEYWYLNENIKFEFESTPINENITLKANWTLKEDEVETEKTTLELIEEDALEIESNFYKGRFELNLPKVGKNGSTIVWRVISQYITPSGIVLPLVDNQQSVTEKISATFKLNGETVVKEFNIDIQKHQKIELSNERVLNFENLTTEYNIDDADIRLFYEENGTVPYVKVVDFFNILKGFIDPELEFDFDKSEPGVLKIKYTYYSELEDTYYELECIIDTNNGTISTNDTGFFSAYIYSTETNYGRHIEYDLDNPNASFDPGYEVVYDLNKYRIDSLVYEDEVVLPYALVNQLFAGSSYYNVYYNHDGLYGVYAIPDFDSEEYKTIKTSSKNNKTLGADMLVNTFDMLAFSMDYFYGLKDIVGVDTYYNLLIKSKNTLLNANAKTVDEEIFRFILKTIDEMHTSYQFPSFYNSTSWKGTELNSVSQFGPRGQEFYNEGIFAVQDAIDRKWGENRPDYWTLDANHLVLTFDSFVTADIQESSFFDLSLESKILEENVLPVINQGNKFFFYNNSTQKDVTLEVLVKGVDSAYVSVYDTLLIEKGFVKSNTGNLIFTKNVNDLVYTVKVDYSDVYNLFLVSVTTGLPLVTISSIEDLIYSDSAVYMEMTLEKALNENPNITDVLLDITYNTGGNVGALYRVVGFITDEPFRNTNLYADTKGASSSYIRIDGVPVYDHLNWSLLTSHVSFSAANSLATIFKENNLGAVLGRTTGGGASSITPILLPNGTMFTMSSNNVSGYRTGEDESSYEYHNNEFGITPDYIIETEDLYNEEILLEILKGLK